ncbi:MAG: hypothetical protein EBU96_04385 [Actinobacteria bacterium]|nr:hypothetical protein [Actinomycetota bacterium]
MEELPKEKVSLHDWKDKVFGSNEYTRACQAPKPRVISEMEAKLGKTSPTPTQKEAVKVEEKQSVSQLVSDYVDQSQRMINVHTLKRHIKKQTGVDLKVQEVQNLLDQCPKAVKIGSLHYNKKKEGLTDSQLLESLVPHLLYLRGKVNGFTRNHLITLLSVKGSIQANQIQESRHDGLDIFLIGGIALREQVFQYGPFVMSTKEEVMQAMEDYQKGRFGHIPVDAIMPHRP